MSDVLLFEMASPENIKFSKGPQYKIQGIFSTINTKNRNGRTYPLKVWQQAVTEYQKEIQNGTVNTLMEIEHPNGRTDIDMMQAVAKINKLEISEDKKFVIGEAILLDNEKANHLKTLIDAGIKMSVSSRAVGSMDSNKNVTDLHLITYDIVQKPSDFNATMEAIAENLNENIFYQNISEKSKFRIKKRLLEHVKTLGFQKSEPVDILNFYLKKIRKELGTSIFDKDLYKCTEPVNSKEFSLSDYKSIYKYIFPKLVKLFKYYNYADDFSLNTLDYKIHQLAFSVYGDTRLGGIIVRVALATPTKMSRSKALKILHLSALALKKLSD